MTLPWKMRLNPNISYQSAPPFNITQGIDEYGDTLTNTRPAFEPAGFTGPSCSSAPGLLNVGRHCVSPRRELWQFRDQSDSGNENHPDQLWPCVFAVYSQHARQPDVGIWRAAQRQQPQSASGPGWAKWPARVRGAGGGDAAAAAAILTAAEIAAVVAEAADAAVVAATPADNGSLSRPELWRATYLTP